KSANIGYSFHTETREQRSPDQLSLIVELRNAVTNDELELYYQPKLHLRTGLMTRAEVLLRWNHPTRGLLLLAAFMPAAERTGIIKSITDWILDRALGEVRRWHDAGAPVHVAVNISAKSLQEQTLPQKLQAALEKWG